MGNNVGRFIIARVKRPFQNFNLESRAHKVIEKEKPTPAPRFKSNEKQYEQMMKEYPEVYEDSLKKNVQLDKHLKNVFVKSYDPEVTNEPPQNPERALPLNRTAVEDFEYGIKEPEKNMIGKVTLRKALQFITDHQNKPKVETATKIAVDYNLPEVTVKNVLKYFKVMEFYIPQQRTTKAAFAGAGSVRIKLVKKEKKQLESGIKSAKEIE